MSRKSVKIEVRLARTVGQYVAPWYDVPGYGLALPNTRLVYRGGTLVAAVRQRGRRWVAIRLDRVECPCEARTAKAALTGVLAGGAR